MDRLLSERREMYRRGLCEWRHIDLGMNQGRTGGCGHISYGILGKRDRRTDNSK